MKNKVSLPVTIAAIAVALVVLALIGWHFTGAIRQISPEEMRANMSKGQAQHHSTP